MPYAHALIAVSTQSGNYILCKRCGQRWTADAQGIDAAGAAQCAKAGDGPAEHWLSA